MILILIPLETDYFGLFDLYIIYNKEKGKKTREEEGEGRRTRQDKSSQTC